MYIIDAMSGETYHIDNNTQYIQHAFDKNTINTINDYFYREYLEI